MPADVALDRPVGQLRGQAALGDYLDEQVGSPGALCVLVLFLHLAHLFLKLFDLLDGRDLVFALSRFHDGALLWRRGLEQSLSMRHCDGFAGNHQIHRLNLSGGLHVAQDVSHVRCELLVL